MGLGIAIDVFIGTIAKFQDKRLSWRSWTLPVTFTHIAFPAFGYFIFWNVSTAMPEAKIILGCIGFLFVALFIYEVVCETAGKEPIFGLSKTVSRLSGFAANDIRLLIAILAVSWDALWSGPAKAAQAAAGNWSDIQVGLSFVIAGLVVAIIAEVALVLAKRLRQKQFTNAMVLAQWNMFGKFIELTVIGGFGVLSLWHAFSDAANLYVTVLISCGILGLVFFGLRRSIYQTQFSEAISATKS